MKDALALNKIAAAIISAGLIAMVVGFISSSLYKPVAPEKPGFEIAVGGASDKPKAEKVDTGPEPVSALLASADIAKGEKLLKKCAACHTFNDGGANKVGPNLYNIVNANKGHAAGFGYSDALIAKGGDWTFENLNVFLAKPKDYIPGTKMNFGGFKKVSDRANLIAYLRTLSANPAPLP